MCDRRDKDGGQGGAVVRALEKSSTSRPSPYKPTNRNPGSNENRGRPFPRGVELVSGYGAGFIITFSLKSGEKWSAAGEIRRANRNQQTVFQLGS